MITSRCVSPAVKRLKPRFTVRLAAKVLLIAFAVADTPAYPQDIDQLLADAAAIESPLNRAWLCDESENLLAAPQTASNTVLEVQLMRTCVQTANDGSKLVAAEGRIRNLDSEQALNMGNAARMLQLSLNGKRNEAEQGIGSVLDTDFISPLEPWDVRDFSLAFRLRRTRAARWRLSIRLRQGSFRSVSATSQRMCQQRRIKPKKTRAHQSSRRCRQYLRIALRQLIGLCRARRRRHYWQWMSRLRA